MSEIKYTCMYCGNPAAFIIRQGKKPYIDSYGVRNTHYGVCFSHKDKPTARLRPICVECGYNPIPEAYENRSSLCSFCRNNYSFEKILETKKAYVKHRDKVKEYRYRLETELKYKNFVKIPPKRISTYKRKTCPCGETLVEVESKCCKKCIHKYVTTLLTLKKFFKARDSRRPTKIREIVQWKLAGRKKVMARTGAATNLDLADRDEIIRTTTYKEIIGNRPHRHNHYIPIDPKVIDLFFDLTWDNENELDKELRKRKIMDKGLNRREGETIGEFNKRYKKFREKRLEDALTRQKEETAFREENPEPLPVMVDVDWEIKKNQWS